MRWTLLILLAACTDGTDGTPDCDDAPDGCCNAPEGIAWVSAWGVPVATRTGTFTTWAPTAVFLDNEGATHTIEIGGDPEAFAVLPDLSEAGEVVWVLDEWCPGGCTTSAWRMIVTDVASGDLLLAVSTAPLRSEVFVTTGWTVTWTVDHTTCPAGLRPEDGYGCWSGGVHNHPVQFAHGGEPFEVWQGEHREIDGFRVQVGKAQSGSGTFDCDDAPYEYGNWFIAALTP